jgi:hypothetical protein
MNNIFPSAWKIAEVIPIAKNGDHEQPDNNILFPYITSSFQNMRAALNTP